MGEIDSNVGQGPWRKVKVAHKLCAVMDTLEDQDDIYITHMLHEVKHRHNHLTASMVLIKIDCVTQENHSVRIRFILGDNTRI